MSVAVVMNSYRARATQHQGCTDVGWGWRASRAATSAGRGIPVHRRDSSMMLAVFVCTMMEMVLAWTDSRVTASHGRGQVAGWEGRAACL